MKFSAARGGRNRSAHLAADRQPAVLGWQPWQLWTAGIVLVGLTLMFLAPTASLAQPDLNPPANPLPAIPPEGVQEEGVETLTQGPIHEAFANPTELDPTPGPVVSTQAPADIAEEPPEFMPEDSVWIPGYWIWDDERDDYVWVTGVARKIPPGQRYVPGYWIEVEGGFQRVSGFWASTEVEELEYREPPPETLEVGPSSPAPAEDHFWVPGAWNYHDTGYRWRAGYWSPYQQDWVWVPARWTWTPAGCVYLPGFWDYRLAYRGTMFAPVYFTQPIYTRPNWVYRPWCTIPTSNLFIHLWVRPNYCHYYFGDYYGPRFADRGFNSWCNYPTRRYHYDPFFTYANVHYRRQNVDFVGRVRGWHDHYDRHEDSRPARTWREQQTFVARRDTRLSVETQLVARNITEVARRDDAPVRLTRVDDRRRQEIAERTTRIRELNTARKQVERDSATLVQLPRGGGSRLDRDADDRGPGRGKAGDGAQANNDRPSGKGKADDRAKSDNDQVGDNRPGKAKGDEIAGGKRGDRDDLSGKGKNDDRPGGKGKDDDRPAGKGKADDRPGGKGKADDRDPARDQSDDRGGKGRDDGKADQGGKGPPLIDRVDGTKKGRGGPGPKLKLPQEPGTTGRGGDGRAPTVDGGKSGAGRRDNIPPPMPRAGDNARAEADQADRPAGDRRTGGPVTGPPGSKGKGPGTDRDDNRGNVTGPFDSKGKGPGTDRDDRRGKSSGGQVDAPRPRLPGVDLPGDDTGRPSKGSKAKADLPGGVAPRRDDPNRDLPRVNPPGDRPSGGSADRPSGGAPRPTAPKLDGPPSRLPKGQASKTDSPRTEIPRPNRPTFEAPKAKRPGQSDSPRPETRPENRPRTEAKRVEIPSVERPRETPRVQSAPRIDTPRPAPRVETPRPAPRVETPRPAPRVESSRPAPRVEAPRPAPRVEAPRPAPRVESPRPAPRVESPRPAPRTESPRLSPRNESPRNDSSRSEGPRNPSPRVSSSPQRAEASRGESSQKKSSDTENRNRGKGKDRD